MKQFIIYYKVTVGNADKRDIALVKATDEANAKKNLAAYLESCSHSITIIEFTLIKEYKGSIFTRNFGQDN